MGSGVLVLSPSALDATSLLWRHSEACWIWAVVDANTVRMFCPVEGAMSGLIPGHDTPEFTAQCAAQQGMALAATFALWWHLWAAYEAMVQPRQRDLYGTVLTLQEINGISAGTQLFGADLGRRYDCAKRRGWFWEAL